MLFCRSGWTQEQLAKKEDKSQFWVSKRLLFMRELTPTSAETSFDDMPLSRSATIFSCLSLTAGDLVTRPLGRPSPLRPRLDTRG